MGTATWTAPAEVVRAAAHPLRGGSGDHDPLLELIGDVHLVLLGEGTHGTRDFYRERALITDRLIAEKGFRAVAVEADWPDAHRLDRYVRGAGEDASARAALADFQRFPHWLWRNPVVAAFAERLRRRNAALPAAERTGIYGLDLYSLRASMAAVLRFLDGADPAAAARARERYACFDRVGEGRRIRHLDGSCAEAAVAQLLELQRRHGGWAQRSAGDDEDFSAEQNARLVKDSEAYHRALLLGRGPAWNLRDRHMADTLEALAERLGGGGRRARIVVWAHNSHLGDARATDLARFGELNLGQLVRQRFAGDAIAVGFTTHAGTVTAADGWGSPPRCLALPPAAAGSHEELLHRGGLGRFLLRCRESAALEEVLQEERLQRAVGVVYHGGGHYLRTRLAQEFDAVIHLDATRALEPFDPGPAWRADAAVGGRLPAW